MSALGQKRTFGISVGAVHRLLFDYAQSDSAAPATLAMARARIAGSNGETDVINIHGRFVWYELITTDMQSAKIFLFGGGQEVFEISTRVSRRL